MASSLPTSSSSLSSWDAARRDARRIESELDAELASFSKLVSASGADDLFGPSSSSAASASTSSRGGGGGGLGGGRGGSGSGFGGESGLAADALAASKAACIERLLQRLAVANDALAAAAAASSVSSGDGGGGGGGRDENNDAGTSTTTSTPSSSSSSTPSEARRHTAARHRAVFRDAQLEYRRLSGVLSAARERADLFAGFNGSRNPDGTDNNDGAPPNATTSLLRERSALSSAHAALDGLLGTASAAGASLFDQRGRLGGAASRLSAVGDRFPVVGGLLTAIGRRKERDNIIVSAVAGGCAFFTFLYWLRK